MSIDPTKLQSVFYSRAVSGVNNICIAAVAGKQIRVLGLIAQSNAGTTGNLSLINGLAGNVFYGFASPPLTLPPFTLPIIDSGYFTTSTGVALYDNASGQAQLFTVFYQIFTP